ncbi:MAG TPA: tRNA-guanine transglycosylase, partial [Thermoanaerobaculia bacterium]
NAKYVEDAGPLDAACECLTCRTVSRAYLRHLFTSGEIAALVYNTIHNLWFYLDLMRKVRQAIASHSFPEFRRAFLSQPTREEEQES